MEKLKRFYEKNRVFVILMGVTILCLALMLIIFVYYFLNQNSSNVYGNRLNGIETVEIKKDKLKELKEEIEKNDIVDSASLRIKGKIVYINLYIKEPKISDAKNIAIKSLDSFKEDQKNIYDISFAIDYVGKDEKGSFPIMGYKKSDNTIITWTKHSE